MIRCFGLSIVLIFSCFIMGCSTSASQSQESTSMIESEQQQEIYSLRELYVALYDALFRNEKDFVISHTNYSSQEYDAMMEENKEIINDYSGVTCESEEYIGDVEGFHIHMMRGSWIRVNGTAEPFLDWIAVKQNKIYFVASLTVAQVKKIETLVESYYRQHSITQGQSNLQNYQNQICPTCSGTGFQTIVSHFDQNGMPVYITVGCSGCAGSGRLA